MLMGASPPGQVGRFSTWVSDGMPAAIEALHVGARLNAQASRFVVFGTEPDLSQLFKIGDDDFGLRRVAIPSEASRCSNPAIGYMLPQSIQVREH